MIRRKSMIPPLQWRDSSYFPDATQLDEQGRAISRQVSVAQGA